MRTPLAFVVVAAVLAVGVSLHAESGWEEDFEVAKQKAAREGKDILIDFTGSDWCGWCIKLKQEVFDHGAFKNPARSKYVLLELDFPQTKPQSDKIRAQNQALQAQFGIQGFPSVVLVDAKGRPYARTGYEAGGPDAYIKHLAKLQDNKSIRDDLFTRGNKAGGAEKAKLFDEALTQLENAGMLIGYDDEINQVIAADASNSTGLRSKYLSRALTTSIESAYDAEDYKKGLQEIEKYLAEANPPTEQRQNMLALKSKGQQRLGENDAAIATLKSAIELAPDSDMGKRLRLQHLALTINNDLAANNPDAGIAKVEAFRRAAGPDVELQQAPLLFKAICLGRKSDLKGAMETLVEGRKLNPDSDTGMRMFQFMQAIEQDPNYKK